ncbi:MAG: amino acid permease [Steroidobacteraceae bacterium]
MSGDLPAPLSKPTGADLRRGLSSLHVIAIVVSAMIGVGIFIRSASMMQGVGTAPLLVIAWIAGGLLTLAGALSYAELCTLMPRAGGEYVFLREAFGGRVAFLFGWMRFVVGAGLTAAIAVGVATFLADAFSLSGAWWQSSMRVFGFQWQLEWGPRQVISLSAIAVLAGLNCRSVTTSGNTQSVFAGFKVAVLFVLIVSAALASHSPGVVQPTTTSSTSVAHGGFALAVLGALQAYNGWVFVAMMSGEVADFRRNYARDIIVGTLIVIALYVLINIGYVKVLSVSEISLSNSAAHPDAQSVGAKLARVLFGSSAGAVMAVAFAVSALGALHCSLLSIPRIFYAMARDGLFPRAFACVDRRTSVPRTAIVCFAIWVAVLTLIGGYDRLGNMAIFAAYLFYCCNVVGLMVLRRRWPNAKRPFAVPAYPWIPLAFLLGSLAMLAATVARGAPEVIAALGLLALGLPVYGMFRRISGRPTAAGPRAAT